MAKKRDNIDLRSEEVQEIIAHVPNWMVRWGSTLFFLIIVMILTMSWFIKYPDTIDSTAVVTTSIPPQKEYAMVTASIDSIYVEESQIVSKNSMLAVLENTANTEDVVYLKSILDTLDINNNTIKFPIESLPVLFLGDIDQSFAVFENNYDQYRLNKELNPFNNEAEANKISLSTLKARLSSLKAQYALGKSEYDFKKNELQRHQILYDKGVISAQELDNKQLETLTAERNFKNLAVSISQIQESIATATKASKGTEITRTREETKLLKSAIQSFNQLKKAVKDWENTYVLKSDIEGRVSFLNYWDKNQTVNQGDLVFTVIPTVNSKYIARLNAPIRNSGKIKPGQSVNVKLENYPESEFGILEGNVQRISLTPNEDGFYIVEVTLPNDLKTSYGKKINFKQEMRGGAEIITEDLRLLERFFYQFKGVFSN